MTASAVVAAFLFICLPGHAMAWVLHPEGELSSSGHLFLWGEGVGIYHGVKIHRELMTFPENIVPPHYEVKANFVSSIKHLSFEFLFALVKVRHEIHSPQKVDFSRGFPARNDRLKPRFGFTASDPRPNARPVSRSDYTVNMGGSFYLDIASRRVTGIPYFDDGRYIVFFARVGRRDTKEIGADLRFSNVPSYVNGSISSLGRSHCRTICLYSQHQGGEQKDSTNADQPSLDFGQPNHALSSVVHSLRSYVHSLLGDKIIYLALTGFGFAALAGLGGGLVLDNFNRERKRIRFGWLLLLSSFPLFALFLFLGIP